MNLSFVVHCTTIEMKVYALTIGMRLARFAMKVLASKSAIKIKLDVGRSSLKASTDTEWKIKMRGSSLTAK